MTGGDDHPQPRPADSDGDSHRTPPPPDRPPPHTPHTPTLPSPSSSSSSLPAALRAPAITLPTPSHSSSTSQSNSPLLVTPRKRRRSVANFSSSHSGEDDDFLRPGPYDRFNTTGVSPHATHALRSAIRPHGSAVTPTRGSGLPTPTSSTTSAYADALGISGEGRLLQHGVAPARRPATEQELVLERLQTTPTREGMASRSIAVPGSPSRSRRTISKTAERVLDAPGMRNDYYIDVLDWSITNLLAVGLGRKVYLWDEKTAAIHELWSVKEFDHVTSCKFSPDGLRIAVGSEYGLCEIFTIPKRFTESRCRARITHRKGLAALAWVKQGENSYLTTGDKRGVIRVYNATARRPDGTGGTHCELVREWANGHTDRIVGLKWSPDGRTLASGGNENLVCFWDLDRDQPRHVIRDHTSAVRALDWCPWEPELLATGGGLDDRKIRVYNSLGEKKCELETGSQVCTVHWSKGYRELISSHHTIGDQLVIWAWPGLKEIARLPGHAQRPLFLAMSPSGETVVTGSGDENLKFWKCFALQPGQRPLRPRGTDMEEMRRVAADVR
ncbi:Fizzy- protein [Geranomyces variabilis]|nr:Fizzy- protein [Geranomyces variabilis]